MTTWACRARVRVAFAGLAGHRGQTDQQERWREKEQVEQGRDLAVGAHERHEHDRQHGDAAADDEAGAVLAPRHGEAEGEGEREVATDRGAVTVRSLRGAAAPRVAAACSSSRIWGVKPGTRARVT